MIVENHGLSSRDAYRSIAIPGNALLFSGHNGEGDHITTLVHHNDLPQAHTDVNLADMAYFGDLNGRKPPNLLT